ncbi:unnamed protein product, partial [marine sediment metagenome]
LKISILIQQMVLIELGLYCSERLGIQDLYLLRAVDLLIFEVEENNKDWLKEKYKEKGKDWEKVKEDIERLRYYLSKAKTFYDGLADKSFKKAHSPETIEGAILSYFKKRAYRISLLQPTLYELFIILVKNSDIQVKKIHSEHLKILEQLGMRKMFLQKKPKSDVVTDNTAEKQIK